MHERIRLRIGELAHLQNISNQTLHHYDKIGLLKSKQEGRNGYRYYDQIDIYRLDKISALKDMGMSLREIRETILVSNSNEALERIGDQSKYLDNEIQKLQSIKGQLDDRMKRVARYHRYLEEDGEGLELFPLEKIRLLRITVDVENILNFEKNLKKLYFHTKTLEPYRMMDPIAMIGWEQLIEIQRKNFTPNYMAFPVTSKHISPYYTTMDPALYACLYHKGNYESMESTYRKLFHLIEENRLKISGDSLEIAVIDGFVIEDIEQFVTQILIPVIEM